MNHANCGENLSGAAVEPGNFPHIPNKSPRLRILVVDDEPLIRWSLSESLVDCGHEVTGVADGRSAIAAVGASSEPFDVVLLDLRLPDSNDLSLLTRIRRISPRTQVILMTAFGSAETLQGALDLGAFQVVSKPFEISDLARLVLQAHGTPDC